MEDFFRIVSKKTDPRVGGRIPYCLLIKVLTNEI